MGALGNNSDMIFYTLWLVITIALWYKSVCRGDYIPFIEYYCMNSSSQALNSYGSCDRNPCFSKGIHVLLFTGCDFSNTHLRHDKCPINCCQN